MKNYIAKTYMSNFRECNECTMCCSLLNGEAYGYDFGDGKKCKFLCETGCSIHKLRPNVCKNYFCAWSQKLLPEEMRPDKCGILASVENKEGIQYLRLVGELKEDIELFFKEWSKKMNTPVLYKDKVL